MAFHASQGARLGCPEQPVFRAPFGSAVADRRTGRDALVSDLPVHADARLRATKDAGDSGCSGRRDLNPR